MGAALDARGITSADNLVGEVEGDIEDVEGVLRITKIRIRYRFRAPANERAAAERAVASHADKCPAYNSVKGCIECSWQAEILEG